MPDQPILPLPTASTPRAQVPAAYQWRIRDCFPDDATWTAKFGEAKALIQSLGGLAKGWTATPKALLAFMEAWSDVNQRVGLLSAYPRLQLGVDLNNSVYINMQGEIQGVQSALGTQLAFMNPELIKLGRAKVEAYLKAEPGLKPYRPMFLSILLGKGHTPSQEIGAVVSMAYEVTCAPATAFGSLCNEADLASPSVTLANGKTFTVSSANWETFVGLTVQADRLLWDKAANDNTQNYATTFATLLDSAIRLDWFNAKVEQYPTCLDAMMAPLAMPATVYDNLTGTIKGNLAPLYRYLRLCRTILGVQVLHNADTSCPLAPAAAATYTFAEAQAILLKASGSLGPAYAQGLNEAFTQGWIDPYPNLGKAGDEYDGCYGVHPFVAELFDGSVTEVQTLSWCLGGAMQQFFVNQAQPYASSGIPNLFSSIGGTLQQALVIQELLQGDGTDALKLYVLGSYVSYLWDEIFAPARLAEFERALHTQVEQGGSLTSAWLSQTYLASRQAWYGQAPDVFVVDDYLQIGWAENSDFFCNFGSFPRLVGTIAAFAFYEDIQTHGDAGRDRYLAFLGAGTSLLPMDALKAAGIDLTTPQPALSMLKAFDDLVARLEVLAGQPAPAPQP